MRYSFVDNGQSHLMLNPRLPLVEKRQLENWFEALVGFDDHYWVQSSGSSAGADQSAKLIALSKKAFRSSAAAANRFLAVSEKDVWGLNLPDFHVGGLSIWARAELSGSRVADLRGLGAGSFRDQLSFFISRLQEESVTLLSLVPTQVYDLVQQKISAPPGLRAVLVGGAALEMNLYREARQLGWPLLPSFGMTEACSQIATAPLTSLQVDPQFYPELQVLDHLRLSLDTDGHLVLAGDSLLSGFCIFTESGVIYHDCAGSYVSGDRAELSQGAAGEVFLRPLGRSTEFVKIMGEGVSLLALREKFAHHAPAFSQRLILLAIPDERQGAKLIAVTDEQIVSDFQKTLDSWNQSAFPPERIQDLIHVERIPRTELGKVAWGQLKTMLSVSPKDLKI